ncbi:MAG: cobaltochelatase subunit CobN [Cyanobacteria bacterium P01_F01_bin.143]
MHKIAATPGGWSQDTEGVIFIEQNPAPIVFLTAADNEIQTLARSLTYLPRNFPQIRVANLLQLQQQLSIDTYADTVLIKAEIIILRLLGGRAYWAYGLERVKEVVEQTNGSLLVLPGDDQADPDLSSHSTTSLSIVNKLWNYFIEGGVKNYVYGFKFIADTCLNTNYNPPQPKVVPRLGIGFAEVANNNSEIERAKTQIQAVDLVNNQEKKLDKLGNKRVGIIFYRSHYLAGNISPIQALSVALLSRNITAIPIFISSLREPELQAQLLAIVQEYRIEVLLNTTSFSVAKVGNGTAIKFWQQLNIPVLQVILSSSTKQQWESSSMGLTPKDVAMNIALPEVDGRIITRAISFKTIKQHVDFLETDVVVYEARRDRVDFVADLAANWLKLKNTKVADKKVALILANYPNKDGRLANGVGLDTPASCIEILQALQKAGYTVSDIPETGDDLIKLLTTGVTNDLESQELRQVYQSLVIEEYQQYFATLPKKIQQDILNRWGNINVETCRRHVSTITQSLVISGIQLGNIFIGIQPSRGYDRDPSLNYHAPDLEPTHDYLAYYYWLREKFQAQAIIHLGKHGNLEWLPGKSLALSNSCYPEVALQTMPNIYPFIVNDPGEGSQAKRRSQAVIIDHLTPPLTRAELYGGLEKLEALIDEYYEAVTLDPGRLDTIRDRIDKLVKQENLDRELGITTESITEFLNIADGYLCELKEAQIRDGLHILGKCPEGRQLRDLIIAIARFSNIDEPGLTDAIAQDLGWEGEIGRQGDKGEQIAAEIIDQLLADNSFTLDAIAFPQTTKKLNWIKNTLLPSLQQTDQEIINLLRALDGEYIPSGTSGAPTRGRPEVLPTGRNFYSVDIRAIPTETAWEVGSKAAETLIERYTQENGEYPQTLAISIWGTSTMRTGGDDIAQVMALMGVRPVWDGLSRRVVDFEILHESVLNRPRVDVTVRVSGFFRDSFPNILNLLNKVTQAVADLPESAEVNPLAERVAIETNYWQEQGLDVTMAQQRASYRIFGSKPGAYGAGLQGLIEAQNWQSDEDLARAYMNWSSYAYDAQGKGHSAPESFQTRLKELQIVLQNQDNREHDLLDSDDYYQFQGGLTAAVRSLTGKNPEVYFGDNSLPSNPKVRKLSEEVARVYRSRVINPKWIQGVMRHGYKGAFEMAATVDYLFAYDATTKVVNDYMYQGVAEAYVLDDEVQRFVRDKNPWALRDMAERLLEASQRGMWQEVSDEMLDDLRHIVNEAEGEIEGINY